jgi:hypothetical protein
VAPFSCGMVVLAPFFCGVVLAPSSGAEIGLSGVAPFPCGMVLIGTCLKYGIGTLLHQHPNNGLISFLLGTHERGLDIVKRRGLLGDDRVHLQPIAAREGGISHRFSSALDSTDSLTRCNGQRRWCQLSIELDSQQYRFTYFL